MKLQKDQPQMFTVNTLYSKGWTIRQAARRLGRSYSHVAQVLRGNRKSTQLLTELKSLPEKTLNLRERATAACK